MRSTLPMVVRAGTRTRIFHRFSSSLVQDISIDVESVDGGDGPTGTLEVHGSRWLFSTPVVTHPLAHTQTVTKGFWDTRYAIFVTPDQDVRVTVHRPRWG